MLYTISKKYGVPARKGALVRFKDVSGKIFTGVIRRAIGANLGVEFQGSAGIKPLHPTWNLEYLE